MKKKQVIYKSVIFMLTIFLLKAPWVNSNSQADQDSPVNRNIQYSFTVQNKTNKLIKSADFWTYAPVKETCHQTCLNIKTSSPCQIIADDFGNQILHFVLKDIAPYDSLIISIEAQILLSNEHKSNFENKLDSFLKSEKYIESENIEMVELAKKLQATNKLMTATKAFNWIANNIQNAGYTKNPRGANYTLKNMKGDCTEQMYLFIALCRANNIPARGVGGYICYEDKLITPYEYHNWAEFYCDGKWEIADPFEKCLMPDKSNYIAMKILGKSTNSFEKDFNKFSYTGEGIIVKMNE